MGKFSDDYVYKLRRENKELIDEVDHLSAQIDASRKESVEFHFISNFGLTSYEAKIIDIMIGEGVCTSDRLSKLKRKLTSHHSLRVHIRNIRKKIPDVEIINYPNFGYGLSHESRAKYIRLGLLSCKDISHDNIHCQDRCYSV